MQDSATPPSVRGLWRSATRSYLCRLASETRVALSRAGPIFDAWCQYQYQCQYQYWPIRATAGGAATPASYRNIKTRWSQRGRWFKALWLQTVLLPLLAFSWLLNITASTPTAKQHQIIVLIGGLAGWSHFDDLSSRVDSLPCVEQRALSCCVHVLLVCEYRHW